MTFMKEGAGSSPVSYIKKNGCFFYVRLDNSLEGDLYKVLVGSIIKKPSIFSFLCFTIFFMNGKFFMLFYVELLPGFNFSNVKDFFLVLFNSYFKSTTKNLFKVKKISTATNGSDLNCCILVEFKGLEFVITKNISSSSFVLKNSQDVFNFMFRISNTGFFSPVHFLGYPFIFG